MGVGAEGVLGWLSGAFVALHEYSLEPEWLLPAGGDRVVLAARERLVGRTSGIATERVIGSVYTVRDGLIARIEAFPTGAGGSR